MSALGERTRHRLGDRHAWARSIVPINGVPCQPADLVRGTSNQRVDDEVTRIVRKEIEEGAAGNALSLRQALRSVVRDPVYSDKALPTRKRFDIRRLVPSLDPAPKIVADLASGPATIAVLEALGSVASKRTFTQGQFIRYVSRRLQDGTSWAQDFRRLSASTEASAPLLLDAAAAIAWRHFKTVDEKWRPFYYLDQWFTVSFQDPETMLVAPMKPLALGKVTNRTATGLPKSVLLVRMEHGELTSSEQSGQTLVVRSGGNAVASIDAGRAARAHWIEPGEKVQFESVAADSPITISSIGVGQVRSAAAWLMIEVPASGL